MLLFSSVFKIPSPDMQRTQGSAIDVTGSNASRSILVKKTMERERVKAKRSWIKTIDIKIYSVRIPTEPKNDLHQSQEKTDFEVLFTFS